MTSPAYRAALALTVVMLTAMCVSSAGAAARAEAARRQRLTDTAFLKRASVEGSVVFERGSAAGLLPGYMRARLDTNGFRASFTLETHGGTLKGHGSATLCENRCSGRYESFRGTLVIDGGSGRYVHARGRGGLYGVFDRQTYGLEVQTTGTLSY